MVYMFILLTSAEELYIAYNNISDLSQLTWLDHLEVLDLEGNNIEDINQVQYLRLCCKLSHLTVEGNLICLKPNAESAEVRTWFAHIVFFFLSVLFNCELEMRNVSASSYCIILNDGMGCISHL